MDKSGLEFYKNKLIEEKKDTIETLNDMNNVEFGSMDMYYTENSGYDNHPADIATEVYMMERDKGFKDKLANTLHEIDESLKDIDDGIYGVCNSCKKEIDRERLNLIPYLKTCIECAQEIFPAVGYRQFDVQQSQGNIFGVSKDDSVEFDGEDAYQKVALFNIVENDPSMSTGDNMGIMDEEDSVENIENISQEYYDETLK